MSRSYSATTRGIVISRRAAAEGSVRANIYTEQFGLVSAFAKSAREERSKLRAHLQVGSFGLYTIVRSARDTRVTGAAKTQNIHFELSSNSEAQAASARVLSVVRQLIHGEDENPELFNTLWCLFSALPRFEGARVHTAERLGVVRILSALGYTPIPTTIPHINRDEYSSSILAAVAPYENDLTKLINTALAASHLE